MEKAPQLANVVDDWGVKPLTLWILSYYRELRIARS